MQQIKSIQIGWEETSRLCLSFNKVSWGFATGFQSFQNHIFFQPLFIQIVFVASWISIFLMHLHHASIGIDHHLQMLALQETDAKAFNSILLLLINAL